MELLRTANGTLKLIVTVTDSTGDKGIQFEAEFGELKCFNDIFERNTEDE